MAPLIAATLGDLARVAWSSVLASVGVSVLFAAAVVELIRAGELRRGGRAGAAAIHAVAALVALLICLAAVVYGILLVGRKS